MVNFQISPASLLSGSIRVASDKSISHRALLLGAVADGVTTARHLLMGEDSLATLNALRLMGVPIDLTEEGVATIQGVGLRGLQAPEMLLDCGNAGTGMRLLAGLLAAQSFDSELVGDESLMRRPMARVVSPLNKMGANIEMSEAGCPPLKIRGDSHLHGCDFELTVASAQVKSAILLAGMNAEGKTIVIEPGVTRDHTERMLEAMGYPIVVEGATVTLEGGAALHAIDIDIPADISSAAFFIVAATITPGADVILRDVGVNPTRTGIITILKLMGADIDIQNKRLWGAEPVADLHVRYAKLSGLEIPKAQISLAIDEFPVIFIAAACASGTTTLRGAKELRVKETDRISAMAEGLEHLGIAVKTYEDGIAIEGGVLQEGGVNSYGDHRIAMAFAVAGCVAKGVVTIKDCANVATSFPNFVALASEVGFSIEVINDE